MIQAKEFGELDEVNDFCKKNDVIDIKPYTFTFTENDEPFSNDPDYRTTSSMWYLVIYRVQ